jgi:hypothetical protein
MMLPGLSRVERRGGRVIAQALWQIRHNFGANRCNPWVFPRSSWVAARLALLNWGDIMAETVKTRLTDRNSTKGHF